MLFIVDMFVSEGLVVDYEEVCVVLFSCSAGTGEGRGREESVIHCYY